MSSPFTVVNPASELAITTVASLDEAEVDAVIDRAARAAPRWRAVSAQDRGRLLRRFAEVVDENLDELAALEVANAGHTVTNARGEAANVRDVLEYYSAAPERLLGRQIPVSGGWDVTFYEALGVVGVIVPWNFPMTIAAWGFAPALAAGNTVVVKPAELTPLTALRLERCGLEAGLPDGVLQVATGPGSVVGRRFVEHPAVRKVCFTGSTEIGRQVMVGCAAQVKRITLELGGKSANIVFADADIEQAAATAPPSVFDNAGQDCCARSRILVERSVFDAFMEAFERSVRDVKVADPADPSSEMGPLISAEHRARVSSFIEPDTSIAFRGSAPAGPGYWFPPTVLHPVQSHERVWREEIFGPVVAVTSFVDEAEAVALANDTPFGLSGSIWTSSLGRALRVARAVETGNLSINSHSSVRYSTPFGGFKQSGLGRELGPDALAAFTDEKNVFLSDGG